MPDLHAGFRRPDADARGEGLFAFLDQVHGLPQVQAIKRRMTGLLAPRAGQRLLEVGCCDTFVGMVVSARKPQEARSAPRVTTEVTPC